MQCAKFPSLCQSFGHFLYLHKVETKTVRYAGRQTIMPDFWFKAGIPVQAEQHCIKKLESDFYEWKGLQKRKNRTNEAHQLKQQQLISQLDELFDIVPADALSLITKTGNSCCDRENTNFRDLLVH